MNIVEHTVVLNGKDLMILESEPFENKVTTTGMLDMLSRIKWPGAHGNK